MIDDIDSKILTLLQENARISNAEIARRISMAPSGVLDRIRRLEDRGVISGYTVRLDASKLGQGLLAFVQVRTVEQRWQTGTAEDLASVPGVLEVHHIAGEDCFLVKVRANDTESLGKLLRDDIGSIESVRGTRTTIVLETVKECTNIDVSPRTCEPRAKEHRNAQTRAM